MHSISQEEFQSWVTEESLTNNIQQYSVISSPGSVRSRGVAILYKPSLEIQSVSADKEGRFLIVHLVDTASSTSPFQLINIYGPNQKRLGDEFF